MTKIQYYRSGKLWLLPEGLVGPDPERSARTLSRRPGILYVLLHRSGRTTIYRDGKVSHRDREVS